MAGRGTETGTETETGIETGTRTGTRTETRTGTRTETGERNLRRQGRKVTEGLVTAVYRGRRDLVQHDQHSIQREREQV